LEAAAAQCAIRHRFIQSQRRRKEFGERVHIATGTRRFRIVTPAKIAEQTSALLL
jgi:hypothetical protein